MRLKCFWQNSPLFLEKWPLQWWVRKGGKMGDSWRALREPSRGRRDQTQGARFLTRGSRPCRHSRERPEAAELLWPVLTWNCTSHHCANSGSRMWSCARFFTLIFRTERGHSNLSHVTNSLRHLQIHTLAIAIWSQIPHQLYQFREKKWTQCNTLPPLQVSWGQKKSFPHFVC